MGLTAGQKDNLAASSVQTCAAAESSIYLLNLDCNTVKKADLYNRLQNIFSFTIRYCTVHITTFLGRSEVEKSNTLF